MCQVHPFYLLNHNLNEIRHLLPHPLMRSLIKSVNHLAFEVETEDEDEIEDIDEDKPVILLLKGGVDLQHIDEEVPVGGILHAALESKNILYFLEVIDD